MPFLCVAVSQAARNQVRSGRWLPCSTVPAVTETCRSHTIPTQSAIRRREALTPRRGAAQGDDMADLQAAIADDDALDHELQDRLLVGQRRLVQAAADAGAERRQVHPRRFGSQPLLA